MLAGVSGGAEVVQAFRNYGMARQSCRNPNVTLDFQNPVGSCFALPFYLASYPVTPNAGSRPSVESPNTPRNSCVRYNVLRRGITLKNIGWRTVYFCGGLPALLYGLQRDPMEGSFIINLAAF